jgi:uncharacterized protein
VTILAPNLADLANLPMVLSTFGRRARSGLLAIGVAWAFCVAAQLAVPPLTGHVIDQTGTLSVKQKTALETLLSEFEARKGSQVAVLLIDSTAPEAIEAYSLRVAESWKIGRKKIDDGAILIVAKNDRAMRIEVGYGLEGALNDATSKRIISDAIAPKFKAQDFYGGIKVGVDQIIAVIDGEALPAAVDKSMPEFGNVRHFSPALFILALAVGGVLRAALGRFPGALVTGGVVAVVAWFVVGTWVMALLAGVVALFVTLFGGGMLGRGGAILGAGMGRSGGGFSGGGGGFGGGGASGRW